MAGAPTAARKLVQEVVTSACGHDFTYLVHRATGSTRAIRQINTERHDADVAFYTGRRCPECLIAEAKARWAAYQQAMAADGWTLHPVRYRFERWVDGRFETQDAPADV